MMVLPFQLNSAEYSMFVILEDDNIERIKAYDPAEVNVPKMGDWTRLKLRDVIITYATPQEVAEFTKLCTQDKALEAMRLLSRGFKYKPEAGDHDRPYTSLARRLREEPPGPAQAG
jgi:hypothetical protein